MGLQHSHGLFDLVFQGLLVLQHVDQIRVIDLQKHTRDLARQVGMHCGNQREQTLTQHLFLFIGRGRGQHGGRQRLLALNEYGRLGLRRLLHNRLRLGHDLLTGAGSARHVTHAGGVLVVAAHAGHLRWHTGLGRHARAWAGHHGCHHWGSAGSHVVHAGSGNAGAHLVLVHDELAAALGSLSALEAGLGGPHHCLVLTEESLGLGNGSDGVVTSSLLGESHLKYEKKIKLCSGFLELF